MARLTRFVAGVEKEITCEPHRVGKLVLIEVVPRVGPEVRADLGGDRVARHGVGAVAELLLCSGRECGGEQCNSEDYYQLKHLGHEPSPYLLRLKESVPRGAPETCPSSDYLSFDFLVGFSS